VLTSSMFGPTSKGPDPEGGRGEGLFVAGCLPLFRRSPENEFGVPVFYHTGRFPAFAICTVNPGAATST
jgi:hypothetical protein